MKLSLNEQSKKQVFKQLYEEYYAPFCLYAKRFVDNKETREDICLLYTSDAADE